MWGTSVKIHPQNKLCPCGVIWCVHWTDVEFDHFLVLESWGFSLPREDQKHSRDESSSRCLNSEIYRTLNITSDWCILRCRLTLPLFYYVLWKAADQGWHRRCCAWIDELGCPEMNGTSCTSVPLLLLHFVCKAVYETLTSLCFDWSHASFQMLFSASLICAMTVPDRRDGQLIEVEAVIC